MIRKAQVEGGTVVGIPAADPRITAFKGIPFAAPPVGENRWRAPQPVIPWEGEKECFKFAPISMQHIPGLDKNNIYSREWNVDPEIEMDEDCLYLNVWTPANSVDEKLPVFVWFFGGGLREGNPAEMEFDGERIARRGVVVVTVNYRLQAFGFLAHPELTAAQPDAPTNFGHLDQRQGVIWAKNNIAAFGGDPENITIGGQSAGGGSVCAQLVSPLNEGLFQKAIVMSGFMGGVYPSRMKMGRTWEESQELGVKFFEFLGVKNLEEARKLDAAFVRDKGDEFTAKFGLFGGSLDGVFMKENQMDSMMKGNYWHMPIMMSYTAGEFKSDLQAANLDEFKALAKECLGENAEKFLELCGDDLEKAIDTSRISGLEVGLRTFAKKNKENGIDAPLFFSVFNPSIPGWDNPGTFHSSDLWFWWENLAKCWRPFQGPHYDLARFMCNYLSNFVKCGDPNGLDNDGTPMTEWFAADAEKPGFMWLEDGKTAFRHNAPCPITELVMEAYKKRF
ncbi:MAG: carboxylesterase family protein [Lachnospiraceae bacterium]|nr:carboxylesterase family protein [Lachnospiraceae bacterium]